MDIFSQRAEKILLQRTKFWRAHDALKLALKDEEEEPEETAKQPKVPIKQRWIKEPWNVIKPTHPGPPHPCSTKRDLNFDPVLFIASRCRADARLSKRQKETDRDGLLRTMQGGLLIKHWCEEERIALAGHLLLLCALANDEQTARQCAKALRSERCRMRDILPVVLSWGAATEDLQLRQDFQLTEVTPAKPSAWNVRYTLTVLPALLRKSSTKRTLRSSSSTVLDTPIADVALVARGLVLCALDAGIETSEYILALTAVVASVKPWTESSVKLLADAMYIPTAHIHAQAWVITTLVLDLPLLRHIALQLMRALFSSSTKTVGQPNVDHKETNEGRQTKQPMTDSQAVKQPMTDLEAVKQPITNFKKMINSLGYLDNEDLLMIDLLGEGLEASLEQNICSETSGSKKGVKRSWSQANTVRVELESQSTSLLKIGNSLADLVHLLGQHRRQMNALDTYSRFIFVIVVTAYVGINPISSPEEVANLKQLMEWIRELHMTVPAGTSPLDSLLIRCMAITTTSMWRDVIDRFAEDSD